ncbi:MAG: phage adaptor protein [Planctomycetota bacterium]|jgi:hypothetical protein
MTAQELINEALVKIDQDGSNGFFSNADLLSILNEGYRDLVRFTEALEKDTETTTTALEAVVSLPSDFLESRQMRWSYNRQLYVRTEREMDWDVQNWLEEVGRPDNAIYFNWNRIRLTPLPTSAGTVRFRHAYWPSTALTATDEPALPDVFSDALVDYVAAHCFWIMKEYENGVRMWADYMKIRQDLKRRSKQEQMTPDTFDNQRPVDVFNYPLWDQGYRNRGGAR